MKLTLIVQLAPGVRLVPQLLEAVNGPRLAGMLIEVRFVLVDVLVKVTVLGELVLWKVKDVGDTIAVEAVEPLTAVPVRLTVPAVAVEVSVAVRVPEAPVGGENFTVIVQLELAAREVVQPLCEKSLAFVPVMLSPVVTEAEVVFERPTVRELDDPSFVLGKVKELGESVTEPDVVLKKSDMSIGAVSLPFGFAEAPGNSVSPRASSINRSTLSW